MNSAPSIDQALAWHRSGKLEEAEQEYRRLLAEDPQLADAWHLLGVLRMARGDRQTAIELIERATQLNPNEPLFWTNLGEAWRRDGRRAEAEAMYRRALALRPDYVGALSNLGILLAEGGDATGGLAYFDQAARADPNHADAHFNRGLALRSLGRLDEAYAAVQAGLALRPEYAEGYNNLALIDADLGRFDQAAANFEQALRLKPHSADHLSNFGNVRKQQGRLDEAISLFRRALELNPRHALAYNNLGTALKAQGQFAEAQTAYEQSLALSPRYASAMTNLGNVLVKQNRFDEALEWLHRSLEIEPQNPLTINCLGAALSRMRRSDEALECFRRAIEFKPGYVEAYRNRGSQLYELGRFAEATAAFEQALALKPSQADAHFAISSLYLLEEDYARGWAEYEWRLKIDDFESRGLAGPQWDGQPAPDQTILVYDEQGFGDTLQFVRFLPRVKALAARVVFECHGPLKRLFAGLEGAGLEGVDDLFARGDAGPGYNLQVPLMSLGHILHFEADDIPTPGPYLTADPSLLGELGPLLDSPKLKVGLVWQGRPEHPNDHNRSFTLAEMQRLFDVPDVRFYSLQKGAGLDQLTAAGETRITDLGSRLDDFAETAAVLARLDLLISCDSAPVHLAAGLGRPTWIAISKGPDWRWLKDRDDSPWYPSVRLFRQSQPGTWSDVFERVRAALIELVGGGKPATSDIKEEKA